MSSHQPNPSSSEPSFTEHHSIETPEQIDLQFAIAGLGSRFLALAIDTLLQLAISAAAGIVLLSLIGVLRASGLGILWITACSIAFFFLLYFGYFAIFEIMWGGQTPGKRIIGIRAMKETGRPLTPAEVIARNLLRIVDQLPGFYAVAIVTAMLNSQGKRLGDFVAGSLVIKEKALGDLRRPWASFPASLSDFPLGASRLTTEECALVDTFLARSQDLAPDVRTRMADEVLRRIAAKLMLPEEQSLSAESTLELIAHERRWGGRA